MKTETTSPPDAIRARRRRKHARAADLRVAALALFAEKGFDATRTEEIAARAGIAKGTLYLYYPSKEMLLQAAVVSPSLAALGKLHSLAGREGTRADALHRMLSDIWTHLQDETVGSVLKLAVAEARRFPEIMDVWLHRVMAPVRSLIIELVIQGMDRGEFRKMDADVVAHSLLLPMLVLCFRRSAMDTGAPATRCPEDDFIPQHVGLVLQGLGREPQE